MKAKVFLIFLSLISVLIYAQKTKLSMNEYLELVVEFAEEVELARDNAERSRDAYDEAKLSQSSLFDVELAEIYADYQQQVVLNVKNSVILAAVQQYFSWGNSSVTVEFATRTEEIKNSEYQRNLERYENNLIAVNTKELSNIAYLNSVTARLTEESNNTTNRKELFRLALLPWETTMVDSFNYGPEMPDPPELSSVLTGDPLILKLEGEISVYEAKLEQLSKSVGAAPREIEQLENDLDSLNRELHNRVWHIEDLIDDYTDYMKNTALTLEAARIRKNIQQRTLETTRLQFEQGEIYQSDVYQAELDVLLAEHEINRIIQGRFIWKLKLLLVQNEFILDYF